jgi:polyhydroxyalkanoate synthase
MQKKSMSDEQSSAIERSAAAALPPMPTYQPADPQEMAENMLRLVEQSGRLMADMVEKADKQSGPFSIAQEVAHSSQAWGVVAQRLMSDPARLAEAQGELMRNYMQLWNMSLRRIMGEEVAPVAKPDPGDSRFKDPDWNAHPYFDFWKQAYLMTTRWAEMVLSSTEGLDLRTRAQAEFYLRQVSSALSPSNFPMTNPEVLRETFRTNARNLVEGVQHLSSDLSRSGDLLKISQTDTSAFEVGCNLAVSPGKVIFQNDIMQLIQYAPETPAVFERPLLMVPPWINKFYILDLTQQKSMIRYLVGKGFTVFLISWVNPAAELAGKTFEDYMKDGVLTATDCVRRETGQPTANILGYCVGGTLLATTLAYAAARGERLYESATFLTTQTDFSKAGDLSLFVDETQLEALKQMMMERGFLDGSRMATVFNMLRPKDLLWPYIVNNYLLGKKPMPFDLLFWNQDSTRMPMANHMFYLDRFYRENALAKRELSVGGIKIDLSRITVPVYHLAAKEDHIAPAVSCFVGAKMLGGPVEFVLAGSGHIAGVINPPDKVKYQYWVNPDRPSTLEEWVAGASETPGSWWPHWTDWLAKRSGLPVQARTPGARLGTIEDAPGSYVKVKY